MQHDNTLISSNAQRKSSPPTSAPERECHRLQAFLAGTADELHPLSRRRGEIRARLSRVKAVRVTNRSGTVEFLDGKNFASVVRMLSRGRLSAWRSFFASDPVAFLPGQRISDSGTGVRLDMAGGRGRSGETAYGKAHRSRRGFCLNARVRGEYGLRRPRTLPVGSCHGNLCCFVNCACCRRAGAFSDNRFLKGRDDFGKQRIDTGTRRTSQKAQSYGAQN